MTCPTLLRRGPAVPEFVGDPSRGSVGDRSRGSAVRVHGVAVRASDRIRRDGGPAQFARFVLVGASATVVYAVLFVVLEPFGYLGAHLAATVASSMLANELHRRLTFRAEGRVHWLTAQVEAGGVSALGLLTTSAALGWLHATTGSAPLALQITMVAAVTAGIGLLRFVALRWIFRPAAPSFA